MSSTWFTREDVTLAGRTWYLEAYDRVVGKKGQIECLQIQVTVHTLPNRADTDLDGLDDSEELNLVADGSGPSGNGRDGRDEGGNAIEGRRPTRPSPLPCECAPKFPVEGLLRRRQLEHRCPVVRST